GGATPAALSCIFDDGDFYVRELTQFVADTKASNGLDPLSAAKASKTARQRRQQRRKLYVKHSSKLRALDKRKVHKVG
ncbi:hypothetical protein KIPB_014596, partial [Kipferlia bialata]